MMRFLILVQLFLLCFFFCAAAVFFLCIAFLL